MLPKQPRRNQEDNMGDDKKKDIGQIEGLKVKKSRHYRREIISEDAKALVTKVIHQPIRMKNGDSEKLSDTRRKDHKYNPKQVFFAGRPL
jgi:hypothetical protein